MKSKIVKQFGAMLLAGTMIVTSGNVTTYAAEQTDESQEVDVNTESETEQDDLYEESKPDEDIDFDIDNGYQDELYGIPRKNIKKIVEGEGYYICKEELNGKSKYVAYIVVDKIDRTVEDVLQEVLKYDYMTSDSVVAITARFENVTISEETLKILENRKIGLKVVPYYYASIDYSSIYFENIKVEDKNYGFNLEYNKDNDQIKQIEKYGVSGYTFTINDVSGIKKENNNLPGEGTIDLKQRLRYSDLYKKVSSDANMKLYYYDLKRDRYILVDTNMYFRCVEVQNSENIDKSYVELSEANVEFYGTYLVSDNTLPDFMVFNLTGLEKDGDSLLYYTNGLRDTSYTGLCDYDGTTYYVKDGTVDYSADMLYDYNGSTWNIKNGKVDTTESMTMNNGSLVYTNGGKINNKTTLCKYNGEWYYVNNGKVDYSATTLYKYNGSWWYIENGKVNFNKNGLCKYNGSWWYISGGKVNFNATGLCKYNGSWWYVSGGKVNFNATGLCKYNGSWWYVSGGKVNFNATGLCKYNGSWWYVSSGRVNFNATGLCKYNGTWWYVSSGRVNFNATGLCKYNGYWFYVENGAVRFKNTLCKYNGIWWYINNGVVNFKKTTLCKYGKNWFAVSKGKVAWDYTGYLNYNGKRYKIVKGVVKF